MGRHQTQHDTASQLVLKVTAAICHGGVAERLNNLAIIQFASASRLLVGGRGDFHLNDRYNGPRIPCSTKVHQPGIEPTSYNPFCLHMDHQATTMSQS